MTPRNPRQSLWLIDGYIGFCARCEKAAFNDRKAAKRYARRQYPSERMQAYACRRGGVGWHVGHVAAEVVAGEVPRSQFYGPRGVGRVREKQGTRTVRVIRRRAA